MDAHALVVSAVDPSGGAGLVADIRTFAAHGVHPMAALTGLTVQSRQGVEAVEPTRVGLFERTLRSVSDVRFVKCGALLTAGHVEAVVSRLSSSVLVVDPVMGATAGGALLYPDAFEVLRSQLLGVTTVVTPNLDEARALARSDSDDPVWLGNAIRELGAAWVVVTGGVTGVDTLVGPEGTELFEHRVVDSAHTHGTGCVFASALTAALALGETVQAAVQKAGDYVVDAVAGGGSLGAGAVQPPVAKPW